LAGKNGISLKSDALAGVLSKKHRGMINYIIQIRNSADHGADHEENRKIWDISDDTARFLLLIVASIIKSIVKYKNRFIVVYDLITKPPP